MLPPEEDRDTLSNSERKAVEEADQWLGRNQPIAHEDVLAEFGLTMADWDEMSNEPLAKLEHRSPPPANPDPRR